MANRKRVFWAAAIALWLALLPGGIVLWPHQASEPVQVNILSPTNAASGGAKVVIEVINNSRRMQNYATGQRCRMVLVGLWESEHPGRLRWMAGFAAARIVRRFAHWEALTELLSP